MFRAHVIFSQQMPTPAELRAIAAEKERAGRVALDAGDVAAGSGLMVAAYAYMAAADELEKRVLPPATGTVSVSKKHMAHTQQGAAKHPARNLAIASAKEAKGDKLAALVHQRLSMSLNAYAQLLGIAPASLYRYKSGKLPCPRAIYEAVKKDVGFVDWPAGVLAE